MNEMMLVSHLKDIDRVPNFSMNFDPDPSFLDPEHKNLGPSSKIWDPLFKNLGPSPEKFGTLTLQIWDLDNLGP